MVKDKDKRRSKKLKKRKKERKSLRQRYLTFMQLDEDEDFYFDEDEDEDFYSDEKVKNEHLLVSILVYLFIIIGGGSAVLYGTYHLGHSRGYNLGYEEGYEKGVKLGYEAAYPENYKSAYYDGFLDGCAKCVTEGVDIKTKIISAYNSLLMCENIPEEYIREFTRTMEELMECPVPLEQDVNKFLENINEILSCSEF